VDGVVDTCLWGSGNRPVAVVPVPFSAWFLDLVFPPRCVACRGPGCGLCRSCLGALRPLTAPCCAHCGAPTVWPVERCRECASRRLSFARARSAVAYEGPAVAFVHAWKERGLRRLAPLAARLVADRVACPAADVITYIPPDLVRQLERSRHPAPALAEELASHWSLPCKPLLRRTRSTGRQASLQLAQRRPNVRGLFAADGEP